MDDEEEEFVLKGFLQKQGEKGLVKGWKKRYFSSQFGKLYYYLNNKSKEPLGFINIDEASNIEGKI